MRSKILSSLVATGLALAGPAPLAAADPGEALRTAASEGDRKAVERALAAGATVNDASSGGGTALMYAVYGAHVPRCGEDGISIPDQSSEAFPESYGSVPNPADARALL